MHHNRGRDRAMETALACDDEARPCDFLVAGHPEGHQRANVAQPRAEEGQLADCEHDEQVIERQVRQPDGTRDLRRLL